MESYLFPSHFDLVTPDGIITSLKRTGPSEIEAVLLIQSISPAFVGFQIENEHISFNLKSTLAQLGINGIAQEYEIDRKKLSAKVKIHLQAYGKLGAKFLDFLTEGMFIGKLFAADPRRKVRNPEYLLRMFGHTDRDGRPLLSFGGPKGKDELLLEKVDGRTIAFLQLQDGVLSYDFDAIYGLLPTLGKALSHLHFRLRTLIQLNQTWLALGRHIVEKGEILLVRTAPLHIRTAYGKVVDALLPPGVNHTSANVLEPDTKASGDVYELYGSSDAEVHVMPVEFYTLEPHREHVFFADRDQLQTCLENPAVLFKAFQTAPLPQSNRGSVFVVKGEQLLNLKEEHWISRHTHMTEFPGLFYPAQQALLVQRYIEQQSEYPFLKAIEDGLITSQGILLSRYFPSPLMKRLLLSDLVQRCLKGIFFQYSSLAYGNFFSHEDRSMLLDLAKFGIPVYWVDETSNNVLQYVPRPNKDSGMFVPEHLVDVFVKATAFGIYGSTLLHGNFEDELATLMRGIIAMRSEFDHRLLNAETPIALVTGGGLGLMEVGNRVAKRVGILSCANIVDFRTSNNLNIKEQEQNRYIEAKMTYRLDKLVERQAEFNLDFPIILTGGYGTDFEHCLEEVRRKVGSMEPTPVLLFGSSEYWREKITPRYQCNLHAGTIVGSQWVSNCFFCVHNAEQGLKVYRKFFSNSLAIGPDYPPYEEGFVIVD